MTCLHCTAETTNGLALCERCQIAVSVDLEFLPVYFRNLARWRPGRAGARPVPGSREPSSGRTEAVDRISRALDDAGAVLSSWARCLIDDRPMIDPPDVAQDEAAELAVICRWFASHLTTVSTLEWAGDFVGEVREHESRLRRLTERVVPGWYAGSCRHCQHPTYVVPGLTWVTCGTCGSTTYARDHLDTILAEARDWVARPRALAEAAVALIDTELSVPRLYERIKKWEQRGKLTGTRRCDRDGDPVGPKRYNFGQVLDRILSEGSTRVVRTDAEAS